MTGIPPLRSCRERGFAEVAWRGGEARLGRVVLEALRGPFLESWQQLLRAELSLNARLKGQWGAKENFGVGGARR